jgi:pilus assembly protein CpaF
VTVHHNPSAATAVELDALVHEVHADLLAEAASEVEPMGRARVVRAVRARRPLIPGPAVHAATERVLARVEGLGALAPLLAEPEVTDVLVNGPGPVWVERRGRLECTEVELAADEIFRIVERVLAPLGRRLDRSSPLVDARLSDGSRLNAIVPPLAVDGPCLAIRRFGVACRSLGDLCPHPVAPFLRAAIAARQNVVISGGTGAGKTTLLDALAGEVGREERLVTIEDTAELRLPHPHVVRLEARPATNEGLAGVGIRELVRNALRLRPDRIIVGEVRGPEALDMLQAMNTGHEGSLTTLHANGPADALRRLETMVLLDGSGLPIPAVRDQIAAAVDLVVQVGRGVDGARQVLAVAEPGLEPDREGRLVMRTLWDGAGLFRPPHRPARREQP